LPYTTLTFSRNQTSTSRVRSPAGKCTRLITARPAAYLVSIGKRCGSQPVLVPKIEGYARLLPTLRGGRELRKLSHVRRFVRHSKIRLPMSALGQKPTFGPRNAMSALCQKQTFEGLSTSAR
jgi:hypothetical protein